MSLFNFTHVTNSEDFHDFNYENSKEIYEHTVNFVVSLKKWAFNAIKNKETIEEIIRRKNEGKCIKELFNLECDIVKTNGIDTLCRVFCTSDNLSSVKVQQILSIDEIFNVLSELHMSLLPVLGLDKALEKLHDCYIEPVFIRAFLKSCKDCKNFYMFSSSPYIQDCKKNTKLPKLGNKCEIMVLDISPKDNDFCKLLICLERNTNFVWLRPLKSDQREEVALELFTLICDFGLPYAFYSKQTVYFEEVLDILKNLNLLPKFPRIFTVCRKMKNTSKHVQGLLKSWTETVSENWILGAHIIQWLINTDNAKYAKKYNILYKVIEGPIHSPYHAMFGLLPNEDLLETKFIRKSVCPKKISSKITITCSFCTKPIYKVYNCHYCKTSCHITCCIRTIVKNKTTTPILINKCKMCANDVSSKKFVDKLNKSLKL